MANPYNLVSEAPVNVFCVAVDEDTQDVYVITGDPVNPGATNQVYKQTGGTGSFVSLGLPLHYYKGLAINHLTKDLYIIDCETNDDGDNLRMQLYKQTAGAGPLVSLNQTKRDYRKIAIDVLTGDVYAIGGFNNSNGNAGGTYKQTAGSGSFVLYDSTEGIWIDIDEDSKDIFTVVDLGDGNHIYKQTGGSGSFADITSPSDYQPNSIAVNHITKDVYMCAGDIANGGKQIFKQTAGSGAFVTTGADHSFFHKIWVVAAVDARSKNVYGAFLASAGQQSLYLQINGPVAAFSGTPLTGGVGTTVAFTDASTDGPTSWAWDFGDGETSTDQNPSHTYLQPGTYTVTLTVSDGFHSDDEVKFDYVTITNYPVYNTSLISAVTRAQQGISFAEFIMGGKGGSGGTSTKIFSKATSYGTVIPVWLSEVFHVGHPFVVREIKIPLAALPDTNMSVIPVLHFDSENVISVGTPITPDNYVDPITKVLALLADNFPAGARGMNNFYLAFHHIGSALLPIKPGPDFTVSIETEDI